jgi:hypothetical protein
MMTALLQQKVPVSLNSRAIARLCDSLITDAAQRAFRFARYKFFAGMRTSRVSAKNVIVEKLGEGAVLLLSLIHQALEANDRIKLRLSLLQDAVTCTQPPIPVRAPETEAGAVHGLIRMTGDPRLAWDSYRRLNQGYAEVVAEAARERFASAVDRMCAFESAANEAELDSEALERLTQQFRDAAAGAGAVVPDDPYEQLTNAARAVYRSWNGARAR